MKIYLMEDDHDCVEYIGDFCTKEGHQFSWSFHGGDALEMVELIKPDLIISDYQMPVRNGLDACENLRKKGIKTPIIFFTGSSFWRVSEHEQVKFIKPFEIIRKDFMKLYEAIRIFAELVK